MTQNSKPNLNHTLNPILKLTINIEISEQINDRSFKNFLEWLKSSKIEALLSLFTKIADMFVNCVKFDLRKMFKKYLVVII